MFDVGFTELCMVGLVALLVIGPEKLPKVARLAGFWVGKARNTVAKVKAEINEQFEAEELKRSLDEQTGLEELARFKQDADSLAKSMSKPVESITPRSKTSK